MDPTPIPEGAHPLCADAYPVTIYYCKAGKKTGLTIRVETNGFRFACTGVHLDASAGRFAAEMLHANSTGKAKASGATCVLKITKGAVWMIAPTRI